MKILVVSKYFYPYYGGIEAVIQYNAKYLVKKGHKITVLASEHEKGLPKEEVIDGIKIKRFSTVTIGPTPITPGFFSEIIKQDFDILHLHEPNPFSNFCAYFASFFKRKPIVITYHSDMIPHKLSIKLFKKFYLVFLKTFLLRKAKKVMPTSPQYIKISDALPSVPKEKITVIPNGVNTKKFKPSKKKRKNNEVFFVGRLIYYKGLDYLIKAMKKVVKEIPDAKLKIGGSGELREELESLVKEQGLEKNIKFLGRISDEEMEKRFQESTVFVLPSVHRTEAFGIVLLEAMACGAPVIATDISGTVYAAGTAGIVVKHKNTDELANAIIKVLKDKKLQEKMSKESLKQASKFEWKKVADMTEKVYKEVISHAPSK